MDPVRFRFMEALERRAAPHAGAARALLDQRLAALLDAYAADRGTRPRPAAPRPSRRKRLAARRRIAPPPIRPSTLPCPPTPWPAWPARSTPATPCLARRHPELPLLDVYRDIWAKVSANRQLRQSEQQVPDNAGPLNSNNLVHRSLALMRQLARLSAPVPVLPGRAGLDGAVRWRGGRCQKQARARGQGWRQGCGQGG